jgi:arginine decarboxylase
VTGHGEFQRTAFPVLIACGVSPESLSGELLERVVTELGALGHEIVKARTVSDALTLVGSSPSFGCVVLDWDLDAHDGARPAEAVLDEISRRNQKLPVLLVVRNEDLGGMALGIAQKVQEYVVLSKDTPAMIAGRIDYSWRRYTDHVLPPFFQSLLTFAASHEYSMHTPGHAGGAGFRDSVAGRAFYDFYGEPLFRTDQAVSRESVRELGSLLDHSGPMGIAEKNAARVFGADQTYFVLNGTSTSNEIVVHSCVTAGDVVLADRNCHKSINYSMTMTDAIPVYLVPSRNGYGIIGPIPRAKLSREAVVELLASNPLVEGARDKAPVYAVVTNSTYDGVCYRADQVVDLLGASVPIIHFDEAWFAHARFHPLYENHFAMSDRVRTATEPTLFATQSTHKLLAAFSQASMIHVRSSERSPVEPSRFNEAYMMHGSTSPFYPMIAGLDVSAAMMDGPEGTGLIQGAIHESVQFRKRIVTLANEIAAEAEPASNWFFGTWQPDKVSDPRTGVVMSFVDAPDELLEQESSCWNLEKDAAWHGFGDLGDGYCMIDPTKITVTTPGVDAAGTLAEQGIPALVVTQFLDHLRIGVEKTGDYTMLVLFAVGMTRVKWGALVEGLLAFKRAYDEGEVVSVALPELVSECPGHYDNMTIRELCDEMHAEIKAGDLVEMLGKAFNVLPEPAMAPGEAYRHLVRKQSERVRVSEMAGRVATVMVVPYPPGIPILMPGENAGPIDGPILRYLLALEKFDRKFPGFSHDIHGVERDEDGYYIIECLNTGASVR